MKRMRLTNSEVSSDVSDSLHMHINVSGSFTFKIGCRIFCFGADSEEPNFHWEKTAAVKERIEQSEEVKVSNSFSSKSQSDAWKLWQRLLECQAKRTICKILDLWVKMCIIHCKTSPSPMDRFDFDKLVREIQTQIISMKWIKRLPNQFIRACHHNGVFLNDPEGTRSIGPHSTEPLESGNHWTKMYDDGYTYRGNRSAAIGQ